MNQKNHIKLVLPFVLSVLLLSCKTTNWYENYREKEKSPFGTFIIFNEASALFHDKEVELLNVHIYDYLTDNYTSEQRNYANYICVKDYANKLHGVGLNDLLRFVYDGNDAFIALNVFNDELKTKLQFETNNLDAAIYSPVDLKELEGKLYLKNDRFEKQSYAFDRNLRRNYFSKFNEDKTIVLGTQKIAEEEQPVFIKIYHGKGAIYLHSQPITFTNYYMLNDNYSYVADVFSYLPDRKILWDPQIRSSDYMYNKERDKRSVFNFFLQNPSLKWSLYIFLMGVLLFMLFNARRKQRAIPILPELKNSTVEFTHTIASLYFKENDHKSIVSKKIQYFLEKVRRKYLIDTNNLNGEFIHKLALKSGNTHATTNYLINTIIALDKKGQCSQDELYRLNTQIDNFFKKSN